jgi:hypothetical protein
MGTVANGVRLSRVAMAGLGMDACTALVSSSLLSLSTLVDVAEMARGLEGAAV